MFEQEFLNIFVFRCRAEEPFNGEGRRFHLLWASLPVCYGMTISKRVYLIVSTRTCQVYLIVSGWPK
jgi:hypothetical protein